MPNPVKRHSRTRRNQRRAHDFLSVPAFSRCPRCGAATMPHRVCGKCGYYRGREVITTEKAE